MKKGEQEKETLLIKASQYHLLSMTLSGGVEETSSYSNGKSVKYNELLPFLFHSPPHPT
jgi:hypothetical protein